MYTARARTYYVDGYDYADDVSWDDVCPVTEVQRVPCQTTQERRHHADERQERTEYMAAQTDSNQRL